MAINLHHLRLFSAVVDHGGFTRAAAELNLTQPAISKSLAELERQLNVRLIDRSGRTATLTDAGRTLHARAKEIFGVERLAEQELREIRGLKRGRLRVAATPTIAIYLLPPILGRFHRRRPTVGIELKAGSASAVAKLLVESRVDVAIVEDAAPHERLEMIPWIDDELVVIAPPDHPLVDRSRVAPADLQEWPFLLGRPGSALRQMVERALDVHRVKLRGTARIAGIEAVKQSVAAGLGLAFISRAAAADQLALGRLAIVTVDGLVIRRQLVRLKLRGRLGGISPASRELESLLDEASTNDVASDATGIADLPAGDHIPGGGNGDPVVL
jgi:DNA-binding transcriptional LysR family regulator